MPPNALKTFTKKYAEFRQWKHSNAHLRPSLDIITPVGLACSEVYQICTSPSFRRFEKDDKGVRAKYNGEDFDKFVQVIYLRNAVTNRKNKRVTNREQPDYILDEPVYSLLKWPGGKQSELRSLLSKDPEMFPSKIVNYYEPFVGGGAFYFSIKAANIFINDKCKELIKLYTFIKQEDREFYLALRDITIYWTTTSKLVESQRKKILSIYKSGGDFVEFLGQNKNSLWDKQGNEKIFAQKLKRIRKIENKNGTLSNDDILSNVECALKSTAYTLIRDMYNHGRKYKLTDRQKVVCFYFLRDYCFSSMFRFNKSGEFNVPYGGISYNRKLPDFRQSDWKSVRVVSHLQNTVLANLDFQEFFSKYPPGKGDFIFVDPPYDSEFSTYAKEEFAQEEHRRLAKWLLHTDAHFMLIIKNTNFIYDLYSSKRISRIPFSKKYSVSFMDRNNKNVEHLIIKNY